jgi:hypothetical protein
MKYIQNFLIFLILFGIFALAFTLSIKEKRQQLLLCKASDISQFTLIEDGKQLTADYDQSSADWNLHINELTDLAHLEAIDNLLIIYCNFPYTEKFSSTDSEQPVNLADYGLKDPKYKIKLKFFEESREDVELYFGLESNTRTEYFMNTSNEPQTVYAVPNKFRDLSFPSFLDIRSRSPLWNITSSPKVLVNFGSWKLQLNKTKDGWNEESKQITNNEAKEIIDSLRSFESINFHLHSNKSDLAQYGLDFPDVNIEWYQNNGQLSIVNNLSALNKQHYLSGIMGTDHYALILTYNKPNKLIELLRKIAGQLAQSEE